MINILKKSVNPSSCRDVNHDKQAVGEEVVPVATVSDFCIKEG